ncbi:hypothetical protein H9Q16_12020 [Sulfitobacter sp. TSTF-M16]|uniref:Uncharacterized protein n=1 Tax=Sulfitobacter aestuariivivens TaxID=2766981 RepID=A0A927D6X9_9RHOB|nr:hypothetical protein [Sulfitobacter aestuariivivens]MBD3664652.1 hypothetical protein [Sulfitobacter aestuariivivens]
MQVTRETPDQLIIEHKSTGIAVVALILALALCFVGLSNMRAEPVTGILTILAGIAGFFGMLALFGERNMLVLDRPAGTATLSQLTPRGLMRWHFDLADVAGAEHRITRAKKGGNHHWAALVVQGGMDAGTHNLSRQGLNNPAPKEMTDTINRWLGSDKGANTHEDNPRHPWSADP